MSIKPNSTLERSPKIEEFTHIDSYCYYDKRRGGGAIDLMPDYYTTKRKVHIEAKPEYWTVRRNGRGRDVKCDKDTPGAVYHPQEPAHDEIWKDWSDCYYIQKVFGNGQGAGTSRVRRVVVNSLKDSKTRGRVLLEAACIDGKSHPAGFYYKLGFRHTNEKANIELEK